MTYAGKHNLKCSLLLFFTESGGYCPVCGIQEHGLTQLWCTLSSKDDSCPSRSATCHPPSRCGSEGDLSLGAPAEQTSGLVPTVRLEGTDPHPIHTPPSHPSTHPHPTYPPIPPSTHLTHPFALPPTHSSSTHIPIYPTPICLSTHLSIIPYNFFFCVFNHFNHFYLKIPRRGSNSVDCCIC